MTEQIANERELAQFLEATWEQQQKTWEQQQKTWERERTKSELGSFVMNRLDLLDDVEL